MTSTAVNAGYWYWKGDLQPANIDSNLFTHLFAAFADVNTSTYQLIFPPGYEDKFQSFAQTVKRNNSKIKALLSIGGDTAPSVFATIAIQPDLRQAFIDSSIDVAREFNYDGLSLNWQYPEASDQTNLATLLTEWRAAVEEEAASTGNAKLLLTAAVYYSPQYYPIDAIKTSLDWINVMAYDLKTPVSSPNSTVPPAQLHNPYLYTQIISVDSVLDAWIKAVGVPANKLVLGLPFHGRSWLLENADNHDILSPANGAATEVSDPVPYRKIQELIKDKHGVEVIDHNYVAQYWYFGTTWIGYDGKDIISCKVTYAKQNDLLGYFAWDLDGDDSDSTLSKLAFQAWNGTNS